jgi:hypothetical protein
MEKDFTPYEQALALKELGFNRRTSAQYNTRQGDEWILTFDLSGEGQYPNNSSACIAPTFSQAFRWFREKYSLSVWVTSKTVESNTIYIPCGRTIPDTIKKELAVDIIPYAAFKNYEEAELECLKKLIEIVKTKEVC